MLILATYLTLHFCNLRHHDIGLIAHRKNDLSHTCVGKSLNLMAKNGLVAELYERFGHSERHWTQSSAVATNENQGLHFVLILL